MDDSFFGFDTSLPDDDGGGGQIAEPPEEEYDALNDETFGSATNGDWEEVHENLVRLTGDLEGCVDTLDSGKRRNCDDSIPKSKHAVQESLSEKANRNGRFKRSDSNADSDLEFNLATMKLDDVDFNYSDGDNDLLGNGIKLDPNVWSSQPFLKDDRKMNLIMNEMNRMDTKNGMALNTTDFLCQQYPSPYQQHTQSQSQVQQQQAHYQHQLQMHPLGFSRPSESPGPQKICTLEDIERNLIMQQTVTKKQQQSEQKKHCSDGVMKPQQHVDNILSNHLQTSTATLQQQQRSHIILDKVHMSQPPYTTKPQQMLPQQPSKQHQQQQHQQQQHQQQHQQQQHQQQHQQQQQAQRPLKSPPGLGNAIHQSPAKPPLQQPMDTLMQHHHSQQHQQQQQQQQLFPHPQLHMHGPPNRPPPGMPLFPPGMGPRFPQAGHPQMPPHPLLNQHTLMNNFPPHQPRPLPNPHLPIALNNFAMHPNFNAIRAAAATAGGIHPAVFFAQQQQANRTLGHVPPLPPPSSGPPNPVGLLNNQTVQTNPNGNMFNMRLMQEIQQNHPLLRQGHPSQILHQPPMGVGNNNPQAHAQQRNAPFASHQQKQQNSYGRRDGLVSSNANGNLPAEEFDEYANLMSTRDKHWLIGIQLSQLNTDTPYIDDYYYTVYRERKAKQSGSVIHSQAHKDNQLNHPLTQPKGHAQLILVQLGNKNGTRNGQQRERHNSENYHGNNNNNNVVQDLKLPPYLYSPLKFENSLGKLQYGSVTAPRKIIDAEIMNSDATIVATGTGATTLSEQRENVLNNQTGPKAALPTDAGGGGVGQMTCTPPSELNAANIQRKSRYILLHIESLYRLILKLDDLNNPIAIATILAKKKKEGERIAALEQLEAANKTPEERASDAANNPSLKSKFNYEIETKDALVEKLIAGLQHDKVIAMMTVRKGKVLIKRIMPYLEQSEVRWHVWIGVFNALQNVFKKDRDDADGVLYALYPQFKKQIKFANFETIVKISSAITLNDKRAYGVFCSKFGLSSLVCLILQAEHIYVQMDDATLTHEHRGLWRKFLDQVASSLNRTIQNQTICAAIESDSIQPMMDHFARFKDLKLDSLLALIIEAKQQIY